MRQFADSLYCKLTPYSITSALITQGTKAYVQAGAATSWIHMQMRKKHSPLDRIAHRVHRRSLHVRHCRHAFSTVKSARIASQLTPQLAHWRAHSQTRSHSRERSATRSSSSAWPAHPIDLRTHASRVRSLSMAIHALYRAKHDAGSIAMKTIHTHSSA
jgi:hypothetical protein